MTLVGVEGIEGGNALRDTRNRQIKLAFSKCV